MSEQPLILIVDDDASLRGGLSRLLSADGYRVQTASDAEPALALVVATPPDLIVIDLNLPGRHGLDLVADLMERGVESTLVVLTGHGSIESAVEATRRGVFDYLVKPVQPDRLRTVVSRGVERTALRRELLQLRREMAHAGKLGELVGRSPKMLALYRLIEQIAPSTATVVISGESGTGKEVFARTIHRLSPRSARPIVAVNCAAFPESLLESELFGHEKGAFTGATATRAGCFEQAHESTLFLDEIGEMPPALQAKLLRVIEDGKVRRVGGDREIAVDVRIVAATNAKLGERLKDGRFREDLFFRLNVFPIEIPPLRERVEDVSPLADHFLREHLRECPSRITGFSEAAHRALKRYHWPGNARELRNAVQRAAILCVEGDILPAHLPPGIREATPGLLASGDGEITVPIGSTIAEVEKAVILRTLDTLGGNKTKTAQTLGISLKTLYTRLHQYGRGSDGAAHDEDDR
jgi:DNA-binding NtrC family response regulator